MKNWVGVGVVIKIKTSILFKFYFKKKYLLDRSDILSLLQDEETQQLERSLEKQRKLIQLSSKVEDVVKSYIDLNKKAEEETSLMQREGLSKLTIEMRRKEEGGEREAIKTIVNSTEFLKGVRTEEEFQENQLKMCISILATIIYLYIIFYLSFIIYVLYFSFFLRLSTSPLFIPYFPFFS